MTASIQPATPATAYASAILTIAHVRLTFLAKVTLCLWPEPDLAKTAANLVPTPAPIRLKVLEPHPRNVAA